MREREGPRGEVRCPDGMVVKGCERGGSGQGGVEHVVKASGISNHVNTKRSGDNWGSKVLRKVAWVLHTRISGRESVQKG